MGVAAVAVLFLLLSPALPATGHAPAHPGRVTGLPVARALPRCPLPYELARLATGRTPKPSPTCIPAKKGKGGAAGPRGPQAPAPSKPDPRPAPAPPPVSPSPRGNLPTVPVQPSLPVPPLGPAIPGTDGSCPNWDVTCQAKSSISGWFSDLLKDASKGVFDLLGSTLFGTPELDSEPMATVREIWELCRAIAVACFVLLVTVAGMQLMAGGSLPTEITPREMLPRLAWAFIILNCSQIVCGYAIAFANALARAFLDFGPSTVDPAKAFAHLYSLYLLNLASGGIFFTLLGLAVVVVALCVAVTYVIRLALTMALVAAAPLALMFHGLKHTEGLAFFWWRSLVGVLSIQVAQSLVFVIALRTLVPSTDDDEPLWLAAVPGKRDLLDLLLLLVLLFIMTKIPGWVARSIWKQAAPSALMNLAKSFILYRGAGLLISKVGKGAKAAASAGGRRSPGPGGRGRPGQPTGHQQPGRPGQRRQPGQRRPPHHRQRPPGQRRPGRQHRPPSEDTGAAYRMPRPERTEYPGRPQPRPTVTEPPARPGSRSHTPGGRPVQPGLFPIKPAKGTGKQLSLPIDAKRLPPKPIPPEPPRRPTPRSGQLQIPGMPKRPRPPRRPEQLSLWVDKPAPKRPARQKPVPQKPAPKKGK
ncbi:hypothetical protein [Actinocorallia longicatena]|uniref:hypothetical protein n=1 Tax=Actinocorallia longicatena TaxID=111803 RepID=UPI0031D3BE56